MVENVWSFSGCLDKGFFLCLWQAVSFENSGEKKKKRQIHFFYFIFLSFYKFRDGKWALFSSQSNFIVSEQLLNYLNVWLKQTPTLGMALMYLSA